MTSRFLVAKPSHDQGVRYLSAYSDPLIVSALQKNIEVIDLSGKLDNFADFTIALEKHPNLILINGHGLDDRITGQNNQVLISTKLINKNLTKTIIYARSCLTANILGPKLISKGTKSYIGYTKELIIVTSDGYDNNQLNDPVAKVFLEPLNYNISELLNGHKTITAHNKSKTKLRKNIRFLLKSRVQQTRNIAAYLWHDHQCQVLLGAQNATI